MFLIDDRVVWSASDLSRAAQCEHGVMRRLDELLRGIPRASAEPSPMQEMTARLGAEQEERELAALASSGMPRAPLTVAPLESFTELGLRDVAERTRAAIATADVVHRAAFYDGEFFGTADFLRRSEDGWVVCATRVARRVRATALAQLAAYAEQLERLGEPVAAEVELVLGDGRRERFLREELAEGLDARRDRLRELIRIGRAEGPVAWGDERFRVCGSCPDCVQAIVEHDDVLQVASVRAPHRAILQANGIRTMSELAEATEPPLPMAPEVFARLRDQAALQLRAREESERQGRHVILHEVVSVEALRRLPEPSAGDMFFDFEGDPMHREQDAWGLEYLWGWVDPPAPREAADPVGEEADPAYHHLWADGSEAEREAFGDFLDLLARRRREHPGMHVFHYAPYEIQALRRIAHRHDSRVDELEELIASGLFVDLYGIVRKGVRISQASYSIKKLEPLYMPDRTGEVQGGDVSVAAYQRYCLMREEAAAGGEGAADKAAQAARVRDDLLSYNRFDCVSTLRLRDWLLSITPAD